MRNRLVFSVLAVMFMISTGTAWAEGNLTRAEAQKAVKVSDAWLKLLDQGKYAESWTQSGSLFRNMVEKEKWVELMGKLRTPLGKLEARSVYVVEAQKNPPRSPEGQYLRLKYNTSFAKRKMTIETVALFLEKDGGYKVAGYFIHPDSSGVGMN